MIITKTPFISACALVILAACNPDSTGSKNPSQEKLFDNHWTMTKSTDKGATQLEPNASSDGRTTRRLSVEQLRTSIPLLFNGVTWTETLRGSSTNAFDALSRTLGEADYIEVTAPNTEPSPLFAKFMDDMAGNVCEAALRADLQITGAGRSLIPYEEDVDRNLRFLRLKFHGIYVPENSMEGLTDLRQLYDDILSDTNSTGQAWGGICVAILTAPEFMAY